MPAFITVHRGANGRQMFVNAEHILRAEWVRGDTMLMMTAAGGREQIHIRESMADMERILGTQKDDPPP